MSIAYAIAKTVASASTPEALGTSAQRFEGAVFIGCKGDAETPNTGDVYIQLPALGTDGSEGSYVSACKITSGGFSVGLNMIMGIGKFSADKIKIKVENDGDGVLAVVQS